LSGVFQWLVTRCRRAPFERPKPKCRNLYRRFEHLTAQVSGQSVMALLDQFPSDPVKARQWVRTLASASRILKTLHRALKAKPSSESKTLTPVPRSSPALLKSIQRQELLDSPHFTQRLQWTRQALSKALRANRVFYVEVRGARFFPAFFTDPQHERRHLEAVSRLLGVVPGGGKWLFFTTPKGSLAGLTPLQALAKGELVAVKAAAMRFMQT
jgi:hypothetical protein